MAADILSDRKCPPKDELRKLIRGRLSDDRTAELTAHVDHCPGCQGRMEDLACDGDSKFGGCVRNIDRNSPPPESALWNALDRAELTITHGVPGSGPPSSGEVKLDFLQPTDTPGRLGKLGSFEVIRVIGRGGMGVVLHAFDPCLERDVAIKILDPKLADNDVAWQRFCREARAAASVSHDNLVGVFQVDEDEQSKLPFLVMQLVNGETLEQRLKRVGKLTVPEAVRAGMQAASGLAAAHAIGLIHRDIKPGNILIESGTDKVRLTDFGLARAAEDLKLTRTGFVAGTPLYMAPEQARGDDIDSRADLFSLGSVLYESLAGSPPFEGKTPLVVLRRVADERHPPLRRIVPDVPDWLEDLIDRLLAKEPKDRMQSAAEVAEVLAAHVKCDEEKDAVAAPCVGTRTASRILYARRRSRVAAAALVGVPFLMGIGVGGVAGWSFRPADDVRVAANGPTPTTPAVASIGPAAPVGPAEKAVLPGNSGAVWSVSAAGDGNLVAMGLEDGQVIVWDLANKSKLNSLRAHEGPVWAADISADGKTLVSASDDGTVKVWDITGEGKVVRTLQHDRSVRSAALNPSATMLVTGDRNGTVRVWDLCDERPAREFHQGGVINAVAFHPDGLTIASASTNKSIVLWEVPTGRRRLMLEGHTGPVYSLAFAPEGEMLASASWDKTVRLWNTKSGEKVGEPIVAHDEGVWSVSFSCCGNILATAGQEGLVKLWNANTREPIEQYARHKGTVHAVRFAPGGKTLLSGGRDGTLRAWTVKH